MAEEKQQEQKQPRIKTTLYLEPENDAWLRDFCNRERRRLGHHVEISETVNQAIRALRQQVEA